MVEYPDIAYFLSKDLISKNTRDEIYEKISVTAATFIESDVITIFMLNEDTEKINCVKYYQGGKFIKKDLEILLGEGLIGSVIENGEPLVSSNLKSDLSDIYYELEKQFTGMSSLLCVPIYAGSLVLGSLNIYRKDIRGFSEEEVKIAKFIAMLGGIFIYSLTLYENANLLYLRQKEESLKIANLLEVSKLVSSSLDLSSIVDYSVKRLMNFTKTDAALAYFKDKDKEENKFCYEFFNCNMTGCSIFGGSVNCYNITEFGCPFVQCPPEPKILQKCVNCPFLKNTSLKLFKAYNMDSSFSGHELMKLEDCKCLSSLSSVYPTINHYDTDKAAHEDDACDCFFKDIQKRTFIGIPVKTDKDFLGMIFLFGKKKTEYSVETVDFIANISNIISVAAYNAQTLNYIEEEHFETISSISEAIEARDAYTRTHGDRLIDYGVSVAKELGLSANEIKNIKYAAAMHDVGKIGIKDSILNKQGKLTDEEYEEIKKHPEIGYNMLKKIKFLSHIANDVLHHQERYDGKGYPAGLSGEDIPVASRIVAVVDTFDAMTTDRPYRKALPTEAALEEIKKNSGTQFDPKVVEAFLKTIKSEDGGGG
jgi:HD-GYP domain-containing protein (c-di-GMP phosphodiesterase class II)